MTAAPRSLPRALVGALALLLALSAGGTATHAQDDPADFPTQVITPVVGGWTLLVNLADAAPPDTVLGSLRPLVTAAFAFDPAIGRFRTYRPAQPALSDLPSIAAGQPFWIFISPDQLDGDLVLWEQPASVRQLAVTLRPGFNLVPWTGTDGTPVAAAFPGLPVRRVYLWESQSQRYRIWDSMFPVALQDYFTLEYGAALWLDLAGSADVTWEQP